MTLFNILSTRWSSAWLSFMAVDPVGRRVTKGWQMRCHPKWDTLMSRHLPQSVDSPATDLDHAANMPPMCALPFKDCIRLTMTGSVRTAVILFVSAQQMYLWQIICVQSSTSSAMMNDGMGRSGRMTLLFSSTEKGRVHTGSEGTVSGSSLS